MVIAILVLVTCMRTSLRLPYVLMPGEPAFPESCRVHTMLVGSMVLVNVQRARFGVVELPPWAIAVSPTEKAVPVVDPVLGFRRQTLQ